MKVLKFGGTSVGSVKGLLQVKKIVEAEAEDVIVVVSALGGITDQLQLTSKLAAAGDSSYISQWTAMVTRHNELIAEIVLPENRDSVQAKVNILLDELSNIFKGVSLIRDLSQKTSDLILSYGERLSSTIIAGSIAHAVRYDAREFIKTKPLFNRHVVDFETTDRLIRERFADCAHVTVVPGFISTDLVSGNTTNLGRGGSDYTAAIIASALTASKLEIWTDVDGFMTADPKVINNAYVIKHLSYVEAMELCNFGAKVIYPPTIFPAYHKNIPVVIRNTFNIDSPGT